MESTPTYGPAPPHIFWLPILFPVVKKRDHKGGAGGLPCKENSNLTRWMQGVSHTKNT